MSFLDTLFGRLPGTHTRASRPNAAAGPSNKHADIRMQDTLQPVVITPEMPSAPLRDRHQFLEYLVGLNKITPIIAQAVAMEQEVTGALAGSILVRHRYLKQKELIAAILAFRPQRIATEKVPFSRIPLELLSEKKIHIAEVTEATIYVASFNDEADVAPIIRAYYPDKLIEWVAFIPDHFDEFLDQLERTAVDIDSMAGEPDQTLMYLIIRAIEEQASDIHIEPKPNSYSVFLRKLGLRELAYEGSRDEYTAVIARVKDRAGLDIAQHRTAQDGSFQVDYGGKYVDLRVATVIGVEGEKIVIRILDPDRVNLSLDSLGISRLPEWRKATRRKNGLCFICGETGSGKSTTLAATLAEQDRFSKAIYSIEDPVELRTTGITSINAAPELGERFNKILSGLLRADPDAIMIGEIRNAETANTAVSAAKTGHLIFATLHAPSILTVIGRMTELGVNPQELRLILRGVLIQALVRTICPVCHGTGRHNEALCPHEICRGLGYGGRTVISECAYFPSPEDFDSVVAFAASGIQADITLPWPTMLDDAIGKMIAGHTTSDELGRLFGPDFDAAVERRGIDASAYRLGCHRGAVNS